MYQIYLIIAQGTFAKYLQNLKLFIFHLHLTFDKKFKNYLSSVFSKNFQLKITDYCKITDKVKYGTKLLCSKVKFVPIKERH